MENNLFWLIPIHEPWTIQVKENYFENTLDSLVIEAIDNCWNRLKAEGKTLFDGWIFSLTALTPPICQGSFIPYRHYVAWHHQPDLRAALPAMLPLGVTGITHNQKKILIGKRSSSMMQFPGCYEFSPAGSVDFTSKKGNTIDYKELIQRELFEEAGISKEYIEDIQLFAALFDQKEGVVDLCLTIKIQENTPILANAEEYQELALLSKEEIDHLIIHSSSKVLPSFSYIWKYFLEIYKKGSKSVPA